MEKNTREKNLIRKNQNSSIVYKIKDFFKMLFKKKDSNTMEIEEEQDIISKKNKVFKEDIKISELTEAKLLELQQRYRNGEIKETELTDEEIDKLCELYDMQIQEIQKTIETKTEMIEEYQKRKKYRFKKNDV